MISFLIEYYTHEREAREIFKSFRIRIESIFYLKEQIFFFVLNKYRDIK